MYSFIWNKISHFVNIFIQQSNIVPSQIQGQVPLKLCVYFVVKMFTFFHSGDDEVEIDILKTSETSDEVVPPKTNKQKKGKKNKKDNS